MQIRIKANLIVKGIQMCCRCKVDVMLSNGSIRFDCVKMRNFVCVRECVRGRLYVND